jgi:hypothetical protein
LSKLLYTLLTLIKPSEGLALAYHPINLGLRFARELIALGALAWWGRVSAPGGWGWLLACLTPLAAATLWGVFRFPEDAGRSGKVPIAVPGGLRLALEIAFFSLAVLALRAVGAEIWSLIFAVIVILHYAASWNRLVLMLRPNRTNIDR